MLYDTICICTHDIPSQVILGEQHSPWGHATASSTHIEPLGHPPLSMVHENSQYAVSVSSHTLHSDPVGHRKPVQAAKKRRSVIANIKQGLKFNNSL